MPRIEITKRLTPTKLSTIVICVVVYGVMWALGYLLQGNTALRDETIPTMFLQQYTLWSLPAWVASLIGSVTSIVLIVAIWSAAQRHSFIPSRTMMPVVIGLVVTSSIDYVHYFDHRYIALILLFMAIDQMMTMYDFNRQPRAAFNIALLLTTAALFEPMYLWLLVTFVAGMVIYRVISWRTLTSMITGIVLMAYILLSVCWLTDTTEILMPFGRMIVDFKTIALSSWRWTDIAIAAVIVLLWIITIINYLTHRGSYSLNLRLNFIFLCWCFGIASLLLVFTANHITHLITIPILLITLNASLYFTTNQGKAANVVFLVFIASAIAYRVMWVLGY